MTQFLKIIILAISLFIGFNSQCQIIGSNLVSNPSFEDLDTCPYNSGQLFLTKYWKGLSTEVYDSCASAIVALVPNNLFGYQIPKTGKAYAGFCILLHSNNAAIWYYDYSEVIKNELKETLKANKHYCIDYYINLAERNYVFAQDYNFQLRYDSISALFSDNQLQDTILSMSLLCDTCVKLTKSVVGIDTNNWFKINGVITAKGGEKYLSIGKYSKINWMPNENMSMFYVYIDDVSVCECSFEIDLGLDAKLCEGDTKILTPNLPNATYTWQDGSHNASFEVKEPGTYWVRAYVAAYDITSTDTIVITAEDEAICNLSLIIPNIITPNGDGVNDNFRLTNADKYELNLQIFNRWGNLIYQDSNYQNDYSCNGCADGVYYYLISAKSLRNGIVKEYKGSLTVMN